MSAPPPMDDSNPMGLFLAHALALENEAVERYQEMADAMDAHNQAAVGALFREMVGYATLHRDEVRTLASRQGPLPRLAPWEFDWLGSAESPESVAWDDAHYLMTPHHALTAALASERRAHRYYTTVAAETSDEGVRTLASSFAAEEAAHVQALHQWLERMPAPDAGWARDDDPPNAME